MRAYENKQVGEAVIDKFSKHLWYLSEQLMPLSFFDPDVSDEIKNEMRFLIRSRPAKSAHRKRYILQPFVGVSSITDLVSIASLSFFKVLGVSDEFLDHDAGTWQANPHYQTALAAIDGLVVVNDRAERCVALAKMFCRGRTKNEEVLQGLFHTASEGRKDHPTYLKKDLLADLD